MTGDVDIYEIGREWTIQLPLCRRHVGTRSSFGWSVKMTMGPFPSWLDCCDCNTERQAAPGYVTPTVEYVPTRPESRSLRPDELALIEMPKALPQPRPRRKASNLGSTAQGVHEGELGGKPSDRTPVGTKPRSRSADGERRAEKTAEGGIPSATEGILVDQHGYPAQTTRRSEGSVKAEGVTAGETAIP